MALNSAKSSTENMIIPTTSAGIKTVTKTISNVDFNKLGFGIPFGPCSLIFYFFFIHYISNKSLFPLFMWVTMWVMENL